MMLFQCSWTTVTLISACKELMLDVFSSIGEDVMVGVGCTARRDARNSDLLKIDEIDPTYAWTLPALCLGPGRASNRIIAATHSAAAAGSRVSADSRTLEGRGKAGTPAADSR
jgi:hypothetical protein